MSIRKRTGSPFYWYEFEVGGTRYRGSTKTQSLTEAREIERLEREKRQRMHGQDARRKLRDKEARYLLGQYASELSRLAESGGAKSQIFDVLECMSDIAIALTGDAGAPVDGGSPQQTT